MMVLKRGFIHRFMVPASSTRVKVAALCRGKAGQCLMWVAT